MAPPSPVTRRPAFLKTPFGACYLLLIAVGASQAATLLRTNFESSDWINRTVTTSSPTLTASGSYGSHGTIDVQTNVVGNSTDIPSKGLLFSVDSSAASGPWKAGISSGVLALSATNSSVTNLGLMTLSFSLRASRSHPVVVRLESFDAAGTTRTGGLSRLIYPATADYYQRFALDLSTMQPDGAGTFVPTATRIRVTFELDSSAGGDGWPAASSHTLRIDNLHYATPAYYVGGSGAADNTSGGRGTTAALPFATINYALVRSVPGDIIVVRSGTYGGASFRKTVSSVAQCLVGAPDAWITLRNYPGETPVLRDSTWGTVNIGGIGTASNLYTGPAAAYLEVRGLTVRGYSTVDANGDRNIDPAVANPLTSRLGLGFGETNCNGLYIEGRHMTNLIHSIRFADNTVENVTGGGIAILRADRLLIENNIVRNTSWWMAYGGSGISTVVPADFENNGDYRCVIQGNETSGNETMIPWIPAEKFSDGNGIIIDINRNVEVGNGTDPAYRGRTLVQNNLTYNNGGSGIHAFEAQNVDIVHNTAYLNSASPRLLYSQIYAGYSKNVRMIGNILVAPANITGDSSRNEPHTINSSNVSGIAFQNNVYFGLGTHPALPGNTSAFTASGNTNADPLFFAPSRLPASADFRLRSASPARNSATALAYRSALDLTGRPRPLSLVNADRGAYQTQSGTVFPPAFSPAPGNHVGTQFVTLSSDTSGTTIVYTTNGTTPTVSASGTPLNGSLYTGPISVSAAATLKAVAWKSGLPTSDVASGAYTFTDVSAVPIPDLIYFPDAGSYAATTLTSIICRTPGALVRYTTDGSTPSPTHGTLAGPDMIAISQSTVLKAIAYLPGRSNSNVRSGTFIINGVPINGAPSVSISPAPAALALSAPASLAGVVQDDGFPAPPGVTTILWSKVSGPGTVTFGTPASRNTSASFSVPGTYVLRLTADDGALSSFAETTITVTADGAANSTRVLYRETFGNAVGAASPVIRFNAASIGWQHYTAPDNSTNVIDASGNNGGADYRPGAPSNLANVNAGGVSGSQVNGFANSLNASRALVFTTEFPVDRAAYSLRTLSWYSHISATNDGANNQSPAVRIGGQWYVISLSTDPAGNLTNQGGGGNFNTSSGLFVLDFANAIARNAAGVVTTGWRKLTASPGSPFAIDSTVVALPSGNIEAFGVYFTTAGPSTTRFDTLEIQAEARPAPATTTLTSSLNPAKAGGPVTFTATVQGGMGLASGSITFEADSLPLGTVALDGSGVAAFSTSGLRVGLHAISARYSGDSVYAAGSSPGLIQTIERSDGTTRLLAVNAAGPAISGSGFVADNGFAGGSTVSMSNPIDRSAVADPAPEAVYQTERYGPAFSYTLSGLTPATACRVRLHFCEAWWGTVPARTPGIGKRLINVSINGSPRLSSFDVLAAAGAPYKAVVREFLATVNGAGELVINLAGITGSADTNAILNGLEVNTATRSDTWRAAFFTPAQLDNTGISGLSADFDRDGASNLLEYALGGTNPRDPTSISRPVTSISTGTGKLTLTFHRVADPLLSYTVEATSDLANWFSIWTSTGSENTAGSVSVEDIVPNGAPKRFLRLRVSLP